MNPNLTIVSEPKVTAATGTASRWSMSQNPLIFKFQRKDLIIQGVSTPSAGVTRLTLLENPYWITAGDSIWWGDTLAQNNGSYVVAAVNQVSKYIDIYNTLTGHVLGWVNDTTNVQNYHVYMKLYKWNVSGTPGDTVAFAKFYDDPKGLIVADLRDYLDSTLELSWPSFFGVATQHDLIDQDFSFTYRPGFVASFFDPSLLAPPDFNTRYWAIKASAQLGDQYGQNMRRYMTYPAINPLNVDGLMHFNSMFDEPYFFDGYPFGLSFVYSDKFLTNYINRHVQWLDVNNNNVSTEKVDQLPFTIAEHGCIVTPRSRTGFTSTVDAFYLWLEDSGTTVASGGGGGGGGSDLDTGPGAGDMSTLEAGIVEPGIVF